MGRLFAGIKEEPVKTYRELDLIRGVCVDRLNYENFEIKRESFISNPHKVMCVKLSTNGCRLPQLVIRLEGWSHPTKTEWEGNDLIVKENKIGQGATNIDEKNDQPEWRMEGYRI
jgi:hypothetical protein